VGSAIRYPRAMNTRDIDAEEEQRPSRTQRKRDVAKITEIGVRLTKMSPAALAKLDLDDDLLDALRICAPLERSARNRQIKRIGKLLRSRDHEAIERLLPETARSK
jgi:ribosome-associated protein